MMVGTEKHPLACPDGPLEGRGPGLSPQTCKMCGWRDKWDFHVPDAVWKAVVGPDLENRVVCLACFDDLAKQRGIDYSPHLRTLYFAGDKAVFEFRAVWSAKVLLAIVGFLLCLALVAELPAGGLIPTCVVIRRGPVGAIAAKVPSVAALFPAPSTCHRFPPDTAFCFLGKIYY